MSDPEDIAIIDWGRSDRIGLPEAVLCEGKQPHHIVSIVASAEDRPMLLTRLSPEVRLQLPEELDYCPISRTGILGEIPKSLRPGPVIVCAGTSDLSVALEAQRTLAFSGVDATLVTDVGVAGIWRLLDRIEDIREFPIVIAVAGMEGALFSVLGGLVAAPLIAVPTSVGYGTGQGGQASLSSALSSCASGISVMNIDNGYGGACAALRIMNTYSDAGRR